MADGAAGANTAQLSGRVRRNRLRHAPPRQQGAGAATGPDKHSRAREAGCAGADDDDAVLFRHEASLLGERRLEGRGQVRVGEREAGRLELRR